MSAPGRRRRRTSSPLVARLVPLRGAPTQRAVLAELRRVILAGDAPPGAVVPLDEVAAVLGMSVIPVRESLKILIGEGLVEQHERGAYTVARLARSELLELYAARGVLENAVLAAAVAAAGAEDHAKARAVHELLEPRAIGRPARLPPGEPRVPLRAPRAGPDAAVRGDGRIGVEPDGVLPADGPTDRGRPPAAARGPREMLDAFVARDAPALLACAAAHHGRLLDAIATLPPGGELFAAEPVTERRSTCTSP